MSSNDVAEKARIAANPDYLANGSGARRLDFPLWMKIGFWACLVIAVAVVVRRAIALLAPAGKGAPPQLANLDGWFAAHAVVTWIHILCALVFVLLLPFIFRARTQSSRALQQAFFILGAITGISEYAMSRYAVGGWLERAAVLFFDTLFLASLARAWFFMLRGDNARKKEIWMIRAVAVLLGIATTRPVMGFFFATERLSHLSPHQFFGIAFWIGFSINTIAIEFWLRRSGLQRIHR
jgi:hypothetical protein